MARHTFGGDAREMSKVFDLMVGHLYVTFYSKISGTSLGQWIPEHLDRCQWIIYGAISDSAIADTQYFNGEVVNEKQLRMTQK